MWEVFRPPPSRLNSVALFTERGNKREEGKEACERGEGGGRAERRRARILSGFDWSNFIKCSSSSDDVSAEMVDLPDEEDEEQRSNTAALMRARTCRPRPDGDSSSDPKVNNV